ncbi:glyoxalase [Cereibacter johrii]|uniref:glyoxalase n=1 Tax=Cereibacter johrii TaxID=445629 RepID=UPI002B258BB2|nr:glyoxalase [Cereibacter johrii]MEA5163390.1 glyoxalase [Cereibacter johrii]
MHLDHVTLRTSTLVATRDFFLSVFPDLKMGPRPAAIRHIPGQWLYADQAPILHLIAALPTFMPLRGDVWDHVAFRLQNEADFCDRLDGLRIPWKRMDLPELQERRIFLQAPGGAPVEVVFRHHSPGARADPHASASAPSPTQPSYGSSA